MKQSHPQGPSGPARRRVLAACGSNAETPGSGTSEPGGPSLVQDTEAGKLAAQELP